MKFLYRIEVLNNATKFEGLLNNPDYQIVHLWSINNFNRKEFVTLYNNLLIRYYYNTLDIYAA